MTSFRALVVLDFEAPCDDRAPPVPQEVIEMPSVLLEGTTLAQVAEFESFVRPVHHPRLTEFCTQLTGITQAEVDGAPPFPEVFAAHQRWLEAQGLDLAGTDWAFVTCGDWDLKTLLPGQLAAAEITDEPACYRRWVNAKHPFRKWAPKLRRAGMVRMLEALDLELEGRHHRGIDDSRNIAKIVRALAERGQPIERTGSR